MLRRRKNILTAFCPTLPLFRRRTPLRRRPPSLSLSTPTASAPAPALPLRHSRTLLRLAWTSAITPSSTIIDATCGQGSDTANLARIGGPTALVHALDISPLAIAATRALARDAAHARVVTSQRCHASFAGLEGVSERSVAAVVYNLGWYPGEGEGGASVTAKASTLCSLKEAERVVRPGGVITVAGYFRQDGGREEVEAVEAWCAGLEIKDWSVSKVSYPNRDRAPCVFVCERLR